MCHLAVRDMALQVAGGVQLLELARQSPVWFQLGPWRVCLRVPMAVHIKKADVMLIVFWQSSDSPYGNGTCIGQNNCGNIKFETPYEHTLKPTWFSFANGHNIGTFG